MLTKKKSANRECSICVCVCVCIYMEHSQFADFFFVNAAIIQNVIYTLEEDFSVACLRLSYFVFLSAFQQFILCSTSNHMLKLVNKFIQQIWVSFLISSKYDEGIHDTIHSRSVFHSIHDVWWKIHDFQFQAVHTRRYFSNISRHWIHNSTSEQLVKLFLSFFLFHFQQSSNKT